MIKANLTALAVVGAIAFPGAYGNTMHIKSFVDEQHEAYHHGGYSPSVVRGTESKIDPPKTRKIKFSKKDSSTSSTGKLVRRTFINQMEYLGMVTKSFRKISFEDAAKFPKGRRLEEDGLSGKVVAKFPPGVFDPAKKDSLEEIIGIQSRCGEADGTKITPEEILACVIYFTPVTGINQGTSEMPYALGTITLDTNLLDATFKGTYRANTVNGLFSPNAMAMMIERECFELNTQFKGAMRSSESYVSSTSYESSVSKSSGSDTTAKVGYGPFGVSAGYSQQNKISQGQSSDRKTAYGSGTWEASIGTVTNRCLQNPEFFPLIKDLFDPNVVQQWKSIIENGAASPDFDAVANGGIFIPTSYFYGVSAKFVITSSYDATSSSAASDASHAIKAGISAGSGAGSASINTKVSSSIDKSNSSSGINMSHHTAIDFVGDVKEFSFTAVDAAVKEMEKDINKLGVPTRVQAYIDLATIVNTYFGNDAALGDSFETGLKNQFAYFKCNSGSYQYFDGFGKEIDSGSGSCSKAGFTTVPCRAAIHVSPYNPNAVFVPRNPCIPSGGPNPSNDNALQFICNLDQCTEYYDSGPGGDFCFKATNHDQFCWYPTDNFPVGNFGGSPPPPPPNEACGGNGSTQSGLCTNVCPQLSQPCS